ncbi:hypothetical protein [Natronomonas sp.]|uniref:hypothetical protein n=1 Tax=Natronomonas sp. TaxID=2184060 RepID=UPI00398A2EC5
MAEQSNPAFAVAAFFLPLAALGYALTVASLTEHTYVHVMAGILWTGTDLFFGMVLGPVIGGLDDETKAEVFQRLTPKMTFLMPALAITTIGAGLDLAVRRGFFATPEPWFALFTLVNLPVALLLIGWQFDSLDDWRWLAPFGLITVGSIAWVALTIGSLQMPGALMLATLAIVTVLNIEGFGLILPGEVRVYLETRSANPDPGVMSRIGMRNAKLAGVQGVFQLALIAVMVGLRWGGL